MTLPINAMDLTPSLLLSAYSSGLFPMAETRESLSILWLDPEHRGIIPLEDFYLSKRTLRALRSAQFTVKINRNFAAVVEGCADREETWINAEIHRVYNELYKGGYAHSVEVYRQGEPKLVGGLYGVALRGAFFGESMFSRISNASKAALQFLVARLRSQGYLLLDTQYLTPHLASMGGAEASRCRYRQLLARALQKNCRFLEDQGQGSV